MSGLLAASRLIDSVNTMIGRAAGWLILVSILVSVGNALSRKFLSIGSNAWLEAQWYLFGAAFLLAAAYTLKQNEHIRIDIVYSIWPRASQHWIDLLGHIFFLMPFTLLMVFYLLPYVWISFKSGELSPNPGGLIIWPAKLLLLLGFLLLACQGVSEIIKKIAVMRGRMDDPTPHLSAHDIALQESNDLAEDIRK